MTTSLPPPPRPSSWAGLPPPPLHHHHHHHHQQHTSIFDASDEAFPADDDDDGAASNGFFRAPFDRTPPDGDGGHPGCWPAEIDKTPTRPIGHFAPFAFPPPPKPGTLEPYLAAPPRLGPFTSSLSLPQSYYHQQQQQQAPLLAAGRSPAANSPFALPPAQSAANTAHTHGFPFPPVGGVGGARSSSSGRSLGPSGPLPAPQALFDGAGSGSGGGMSGSFGRLSLLDGGGSGLSNGTGGAQNNSNSNGSSHTSSFGNNSSSTSSGSGGIESRLGFASTAPSPGAGASGREDGPTAQAVANKDAALELLSRKIVEMEAKLHSQSSLMLRLRDENLSLKADRLERTRSSHNPNADGSLTTTGEEDGQGMCAFAFAAAGRECRTEPGTPVDTAVKCAMGVLADFDYDAFAGGERQPQPEVVARILSQSFSYSLVLPHDYRALTWTLANRTQRSAQEGHALKFAANFLISKVQQLRGQPMEHVVHDAILAEVVGLSQTANGNYLVQQLLECAPVRVRADVYGALRPELLALAGDKYGTHVVCKTAEFAELRPLLVQDLVAIGVAETFQTGARRLWKSIFDHCKKAGETAIFELVLKQMAGKWADCATTTENGTISVQQVFESWPSMAFMEPVLVEIIQNIARIANGGWGHFLISKLLSNPAGNLRPTILMALLESPAAVATGHHGISFLRTALLELGRPGVEMYVDTLCSVRREGQAPQIVEVAGAVVGPGHISFLWTMLSVSDKNRLKDACRNHIVSIRSSQSGNDLLRQLGLMPSNTIPKLR